MVALLLVLAGCTTEADRALPEGPPKTVLRVAKEGGGLGRIDLFRFDPVAGRQERLAHCPEGCAEVLATLPDAGVLLEVVATGWPYMRMRGFKELAPCAREDGGFMSPCRFTLDDVPADGVVAIFYPRPGVAQPAP